MLKRVLNKYLKLFVWKIQVFKTMQNNIILYVNIQQFSEVQRVSSKLVLDTVVSYKLKYFKYPPDVWRVISATCSVTHWLFLSPLYCRKVQNTRPVGHITELHWPVQALAVGVVYVLIRVHSTKIYNYCSKSVDL